MRTAPFLLGLLALLALAPFAQAQATLRYSTGTGFFVNKHGHVVTNAHVVPGCRELTVDGRPATLVAKNESLDIAVLKVSGAVFHLAPLRQNISNLTEGEKVIVMGFPGTEGARGIHTYRTGAVVEPATPFRLPEPNPTDATVTAMAIDPIVAKGNSGGPVLDEAGRVIGVVRATGTMFMTDAKEQVIPGSQREAAFAIPLAVLDPYLRSQRIYMQYEHGGLVKRDDARMERDARKFILPVRCLLG